MGLRRLNCIPEYAGYHDHNLVCVVDTREIGISPAGHVGSTPTHGAVVPVRPGARRVVCMVIAGAIRL